MLSSGVLDHRILTFDCLNICASAHLLLCVEIVYVAKEGCELVARRAH